MAHVPRGLRERLLHELERNNSWIWGLSSAVMIALGIVIAVLYLFGGDLPAGVDDQGRRPMAFGLLGIVVLFTLQVFHRQRELTSLRTRLLQAQVKEEVLRSRLSGLASMFEGLATAGTQLEASAMLEMLAQHVRDSVPADQCSILLKDEDGKLRCKAVAGLDADFVRGAEVTIGEAVAGWVAQHNEPLVLNEEDMARRFPKELKHGRHITSALCVPLRAKDEVIGVLNIDRIGGGPLFREEDCRVVLVFASHIALTIQRLAEKNRVEAALRDSERQLQHGRRLEAMGQLVGGIAHDFNNLLTVVLGYSGRLRRQLDSQELLAQEAAAVEEAAERGARLTRQLLAFSRRQILDPRVLDPNGVVSGIQNMLERVIGEDIALVIQLDENVGAIRADRGQLEQVLMNLVVNARDAMPQGGLLTIRTAIVAQEEARTLPLLADAPAEYVQISVRDTGRGIDAGTKARMFEPFFTTKPAGQGTGLGLSTVFGIVSQSGGRIAVASEPGCGAEFTVYLPRVYERPETAERAPSQSQGRIGTGTILLVEDEPPVRRLVASILESHGYTVLPASTAEEALVVCGRRQDPLDLILTDVVMPGISGAELAGRAAILRPQTPVLYMSGYTGDTIAHHGVANEGHAFLQKPFTETQLMEKVEKMLGSAGASAT